MLIDRLALVGAVNHSKRVELLRSAGVPITSSLGGGGGSTNCSKYLPLSSAIIRKSVHSPPPTNASIIAGGPLALSAGGPLPPLPKASTDTALGMLGSAT